MVRRTRNIWRLPNLRLSSTIRTMPYTRTLTLCSFPDTSSMYAELEGTCTVGMRTGGVAGARALRSGTIG